MSKPKVLTPDKAGRELAKVLDQARREREELADMTKAKRGRIAALEKRGRELMDIANGRVGVQVEMDTSGEEDEDAPGASDAATLSTLLEARGVSRATAKALAKKFPRHGGDDLAEHCIACGEQFGVHDGAKCPPKGDRP